MNDNDTQLELELERIAYEELRIRTLASQNSDSLDFYEVSAWSIKNALLRAFELGRELK